MKKLIITLQLVQLLVDYLTTKPYCEVFQLINALSSLEILEDSEKQEKMSEEKSSKD